MGHQLHSRVRRLFGELVYFENEKGDIKVGLLDQLDLFSRTGNVTYKDLDYDTELHDNNCEISFKELYNLNIKGER